MWRLRCTAACSGSKYLDSRDENRLMVETLSKGARMRRLLLTIAIAVLPWAVARAQIIPAHQIVSGQVQPRVSQVNPGGAWCFVGRGVSIFEGSADGATAVVSLPEVFYFDGTNYYLLSGQTHLGFTTPTSGTFRFKLAPEYPAAVTLTTFSNFSEGPGAPPGLAVVQFSVNLTNGTNSSQCALPVVIRYEAP